MTPIVGRLSKMTIFILIFQAMLKTYDSISWINMFDINCKIYPSVYEVCVYCMNDTINGFMNESMSED